MYLSILNLPPSIHMKTENVLLAGLWYGPQKPPMNLLLTSVMKKSLETLFSVGIKVRTPSGSTTVRGKVVMGVFDLYPGMRMNNGARIYPPQQYTDRTHSSILTAGRQAERRKTAVKGVKGVSPLAPYMDLVTSITVDYMHSVLEGVTWMLLNQWFNSKHHREQYYLGCAVSTIDNMLLKQRPPQEFIRPPRSIQKHLNYWKASELRQWLLYYSLPLLLPYLPPLYWHHYALLVSAMHILLSESISAGTVDSAEQMLQDFCILIPELYKMLHCQCTSTPSPLQIRSFVGSSLDTLKFWLRKQQTHQTLHSQPI